MAAPRVFISHCTDKPRPTRFAARIISLLGCVPVVTEDEPALSRSVINLVNGTIESCQAVLVIATKDARRGDDWIPSPSVTAELTQMQADARWKQRYLVVKEKGVTLSPLNNEVYRAFTSRDLAPIAEAILIELSAMSLFTNYYSSPASTYGLIALAETFSQLRDLQEKGILKPADVARMIKDEFGKTIDSAIGGS